MTTYKYVWGNDKDIIGKFRKRHFKGRECKVLVRGKMNSCLIQFTDNGEQLNCSRNAIRRIKP